MFSSVPVSGCCWVEDLFVLLVLVNDCLDESRASSSFSNALASSNVSYNTSTNGYIPYNHHTLIHIIFQSFYGIHPAHPSLIPIIAHSFISFSSHSLSSVSFYCHYNWSTLKSPHFDLKIWKPLYWRAKFE